MSWTTGERADAHHLVGVLREKFSGPGKPEARALVARYLSDCASVADLWGGGASGEAIKSANPNGRLVLAESGEVCGSDWFTDRLGRKVGKPRLRRALEISAGEIGGEPHWGSIAKVAGDVEGVNLDLCGMWSPGTARLISASKHARRIAVTLLPERDGMGEIGQIDRIVCLAALVQAHSRMAIDYAGFYLRNDLGQQMALLLLSQRKGQFQPWADEIASSVAHYGYWVSSGLSDSAHLYRPTTRAGRKPEAVRPTCRECGRKYVRKQGESYSVRVYCSNECRALFYSRAKCRRCGNDFIRSEARMRPSHCADCMSAVRSEAARARRGRQIAMGPRAVTITCLWCSGESEILTFGRPPAYCSDYCRKARLASPEMREKGRQYSRRWRERNPEASLAAAHRSDAKRRERRRVEMAAMPPRTCPHCLAAFIPTRSNKSFCSTRCQSMAGNIRRAR